MLLTGQSEGQSVSLTLIQGSIGSSTRCMLCSTLVILNSHPLIIIGSYGCYPGLPLVAPASSPLPRTDRLLWCWLTHDNGSLRWDGRSPRLPPAAIASLHIFIWRDRKSVV